MWCGSLDERAVGFKWCGHVKMNEERIVKGVWQQSELPNNRLHRRPLCRCIYCVKDCVGQRKVSMDKPNELAHDQEAQGTFVKSGKS